MAAILEVDPLNLGPDIRAVGLELFEQESREPVRGSEAARIWGRVLGALAGREPWGLDFFSHLDRVRDFCRRHGIPYREAATRSIVIPQPESEQLVKLLERFEAETFGVRAGSLLVGGDAALERDLARCGIDAYHPAFGKYLFCAVCDFEKGFLTLLSEQLPTQEVIRRVQPALREMGAEVRLSA
jgi:hypothetical protein